MDTDNLDYQKKEENDAMRYAISKVGNLFIGSEWAIRDAKAGIVHLVRLPFYADRPLTLGANNVGC